MGARDQDPLVVAVALSLWGYNVSPGRRAEQLIAETNGECGDMEDLLRIMQRHGNAVTELDIPTAEVYVQQALVRYGDEARRRVEAGRRAVA